MKRLLRIVRNTALIGLAIGGIGLGYIWINKDAIVAKSVAIMNGKLAVPVDVGQVDLEIFKDFPRVSLALDRVAIKGDQGGQPSWAELEQIRLALNPWQLLRGNYTFDKVTLAGGKIYAETNANGSLNWDRLLKPAEDQESVPLEIKSLDLVAVDLQYRDKAEGWDVSGWVEKIGIGLRYENGSTNLKIRGGIEQLFAHYVEENKTWCKDGRLKGTFDVYVGEEHWSITSASAKFGGQDFAATITDEHLAVSGSNVRVDQVLSAVSVELPDAIELNNIIAGFAWEGDWELEDWTLALEKLSGDATYVEGNLPLTGVEASGQITWGKEKAIEIDRWKFNTPTGKISGNLSIKGKQPVLETTMSGAGNLSDLFRLASIDLLDNPLGFYKGESLHLTQPLGSWDQMGVSAIGTVEGNIALENCSFGITGSTIEFSKVEATLRFDKSDVIVERCFLQAGENAAVLEGKVINGLAFDQRPKALLEMESPVLNIDPLLFWEFEDSESSDDWGFDFAIKLDVQACDLGDFHAETLTGTVYNSGTKILGKEFNLYAVDGMFSGNWALADEAGGSRLWTKLEAHSIAIDKLMRSFNNFDLEDLDASMLKGLATISATTTLHFDHDWEVITNATQLTAAYSLRNGVLQNYPPLDELSGFIDKSELARIEIPLLQGTIAMNGDTIFIPPTDVQNSAINLTIEGWQTLDEDIDYRIALGLKDLALRGKNSNRDLGDWIAEAENNAQPKLQLKVACTLEDPCISLDRNAVRKSWKEGLQQEKEDLRNIFTKPDENDTQDNRNKGEYQFIWEDDTLSAGNGLHLR